MRIKLKSVLRFLVSCTVLGVSMSPVSLPAQGSTATGTNTAAAFLAQVALKYPSFVSMNTANLHANAAWTVGSQKETGTAVLQAQADGSSSMQLTLDTATRTESRSALGANRACLWADSKGTHQLNDVDCNASVAWFAPTLAVQPLTTVLQLLNITDAGEAVRDSGTFRQISYQTAMQSASPTSAKFLTNGTQVSVLYDPQTLLPSSMEYLQHADTDLNTTFPVRIVYSNYQTVAGVPTPFQIDRYVNGVLQLSLTVTSASSK